MRTGFASDAGPTRPQSGRRKVKVWAVAAIAVATVTTGCTRTTNLAAPDGTQEVTVTTHQQVPHDPNAFTQGLEVLDDGTLIESTGGTGTSTLRKLIPGQEKPATVALVPGERFGEGVTVVDGQAIQLTWKDNVAHVWDLRTLRVVQELPYDAHGWGICYDETAQNVWTSDGSAELVSRDPETLSRSGEVTVTLDGEPVEELNELECVDGFVWANVWHSNQVIRINPDTGHVDQVADLTGLVAAAEEANGERFNAEQVLNGIAYDARTSRWWVTGKEWPVMFEVTFTTRGLDEQNT